MRHPRENGDPVALQWTKMGSRDPVPAKAGSGNDGCASSPRKRGSMASPVSRNADISTHLAGWWSSDLAYSFRRSPVAVVSAVVLLICLGSALFVPWVAPHNPFNLATLNLLDALSPPRGMAGAKPEFLLGTDDQGRDLLSAIMFGARISLLVG